MRLGSDVIDLMKSLTHSGPFVIAPRIFVLWVIRARGPGSGWGGPGEGGGGARGRRSASRRGETRGRAEEC